MEIKVKNKFNEFYNKALIDAGFTGAASCFERSYWGRPDDNTKVDLLGHATEEVFEVLLDAARSCVDTTCVREVTILLALIKEDERPVRSLKGFRNALEIYLQKDLSRGWLYQLQSGSVFLPFLVVNIRHKPYNQEHRKEAHVAVYFDYICPTKQSERYSSKLSLEFSQSLIVGKSVPEILANASFFKESDELYEQYMMHVASYNKYVMNLGQQFWVKDASAKQDTAPSVNATKMLNNEDLSKERTVSSTIKVSMFEGVRTTFDFLDEHLLESHEDDLELGGCGTLDLQELQLPFHPYISMFNLKTHKDIWVLSGFLSPYEYDSELGSKLVLPDEHHDLIDILVNDSDVVMEDIVAGKSGGTTILCKGEAGLGKTLTAQVYSEVVGKPLYEVHTGQLGTDPDQIDKRLATILSNAEKWGVIILLDEADVYIRRRDNSLEHNAIVAAFLRQIECYNGILFMTTNRSDDIDDAILSRCSAVIQFDYPRGDALVRTWQVLSKNYGIEMSSELIQEVEEYFDRLGGRDIKEILKLARRFKMNRNVPVDLELIRKCSIFKGIGLKKEKEKEKTLPTSE